MLTPDKERRWRRRTARKLRRSAMATFGNGFVNVSGPAGEGPYACPCCGYLTLEERGMHQICPICSWEDDGQDDHDAETVRGGPNKELSLAQARRNFANLGASAARRLDRVRPPDDTEHPLK